jgi:hypothetical protein
MTNAIASTPVQANVQVARAQNAQPAAPAQKPTPSKTQAANTRGQDTVQISQAAQQALQAMKEATETASQTAREASRGDHQAQRLLAKETAAKNL